jgi:ParB/RepB/Spo0J family partition protein
LTATQTDQVRAIGTSNPTSLLVDVSAIRENPRQIRKEVGDVSDLVASIRELGLLQPVLLVPPSDDDRRPDESEAWYLEAGHRRLKAFRELGLERIPAVVASSSNAAKQILGMLAENLQRAALSPIEEANGYQQVLDLGDADYRTHKRMAETLGLPASRIGERLKLTRLPQPVQDRVHRGQLGVEDAVELAQFAGESKIMERLSSAVGTHNWHWELRKAKDERQLERDRQKALKELEAEGLECVDLPTSRSSGPAALGWLKGGAGGSMTVEEHAACAYAAGTLEQRWRTGRREWVAVAVCADPEAAGHERLSQRDSVAASGHQTTDEERARREAEQEEWDRRADEERAVRERARGLRIEFLSALPFTDEGMVVEALRLYLSGALPEYLRQRAVGGSFRETSIQDCEHLACIFNVKLPTAPQKSSGTHAQLVRDQEAARNSWHAFAPAVAAASLEQCARALLSLYRREAEHWLDSPWGDEEKRGEAWIRWLTDHGYQLSDAEAEMIAERRREVAEEEGSDDGPDPEDEVGE